MNISKTHSSISISRLLIIALLSVSCGGCWYRQCPIKGCMVKYEHSHGDRIVRGRGTIPRIHFMATRSATTKKKKEGEKVKKTKKKK
jgi:hypothetical protein